MARKKKSPSTKRLKNSSGRRESRHKSAGSAEQPGTRRKTQTVSSERKSRLKTIKPSGKGDENFFELVYEVARQIPKGRVTSYGAIARCLGTKMSARMVGWAMNGAGRVRPRVPAHRVVNRVGMLSGKHHFDDPDQMERLLQKEGVKVSNDQVVDFQKVFWDPVTAFGL